MRLSPGPAEAGLAAGSLWLSTGHQIVAEAEYLQWCRCGLCRPSNAPSKVPAAQPHTRRLPSGLPTSGLVVPELSCKHSPSKLAILCEPLATSGQNMIGPSSS